MYKYWSNIFFTIILTTYIFQIFGEDLDELENEEIKEFVATHEWQRVKPGQAIPSGLHVRMDLSEGGRWAKLLDKDEPNSVAVAPISIPNSKQEKEEKLDLHSISEIKKALKNMKYPDKEKEKNQKASQFRSMKELKESIEHFELNQETDIEVIKRLLSRIQNKTTDKDAKLIALEDIEYYIHQIDNANDMVKIGGLSVLMDCLNSTHFEIVAEAAKVIGSASQSNPSVQIKVTESGILTKLTFMLANIQQTAVVRKNSLFAISSIIRNFPFAQQKFGEYGGLNILKNVFQEVGMDRLRVKVVRLINDLFVERRAGTDVVNEEKRKQYNRFPLIRYVKELGYCSLIPQLLKLPSHDTREACIIAMENMFTFCKKDFHTDAVNTALLSIKNEYKILADEEIQNGDSDGYFQHLLKVTDNLITQIFQKKINEEL